MKGSKHFPKTTHTQSLADIFGKSRRTIQREVKRGLVEHETASTYTKREYNADFAQSDATYQMTAKGAPLKLAHNWGLVRSIQDLILKKHYSPYAVIQHLQQNGFPERLAPCAA